MRRGLPVPIVQRELAARTEGLERLLHEERVAVAAGIDRLTESAVGVAGEAERLADESRGRASGERCERHLASGACRDQLGDERTQRVAPVEFIGAERPDED